MKKKSVASSGILFLVLFGNRSLLIVKVGFWKEPKGARSKLSSFGCEDASKTQQCQQQRWLLQPALESQCACSHLSCRFESSLPCLRPSEPTLLVAEGISQPAPPVGLRTSPSELCAQGVIAAGTAAVCQVQLHLQPLKHCIPHACVQSCSKVFKCVLTTSRREYLNATEVGGRLPCRNGLSGTRFSEVLSTWSSGRPTNVARPSLLWKGNCNLQQLIFMLTKP